MMKRNVGSNLISIAGFAGAWLFAACAGEPSGEGPGDEACEGEWGATGATGEGGAPDGGLAPQRSKGPSTCFVPAGTTCESTPYGFGGCTSEFDCSWNCEGLPQLCGQELVLHPYNNNVEGDLDCVLNALRDGTEGVFRWRTTIGGFYQFKRTITILPDRRALRASVYNLDNYIQGGLDGPARLRDPSYYEACFDVIGVQALDECLREALDGCTSTP
jgi:hypothetical protein